MQVVELFLYFLGGEKGYIVLPLGAALIPEILTMVTSSLFLCNETV